MLFHHRITSSLLAGACVNANNISVQSIASTSSDNIVKVVGRRTDDADLVKIYGTIDGAGSLTWATQSTTTYSPVTIVKL
jgi:hypothetical protein